MRSLYHISLAVSMPGETAGGITAGRKGKRTLVTNGKVWYTPILKLKTVLKLEELCEKNFPASGRC
jgi:hypothetical protein